MLMAAEAYVTPAEFKFVDGAEPGTFGGYGAVFGNKDSHGDIILPGAFATSLAQHKAQGRMPGMFAEHSAFTGGDPLPIGRWLEIGEDDRGLKVLGKLSALDTDHGRRIHSLMRDGAMEGMSIAYHVPQGGAIYGKSKEEARRQLKTLELHAIDVVRAPSNGLARVEHLKTLMAHADVGTATAALANAINLHRTTMRGSDAPTAAERAQLLTHLQEAHRALTGNAMPPAQKGVPATIREFEDWLRDEFSLSNAKARDIAERGFKAASESPRDEDDQANEAIAAQKAALSEIGASLKGFSLPKFED